MSIENTSKLGMLQRQLPEGLLAPSAWLKKQGYSDQLLKKYRTAGWLDYPTRGVYRRPGPPLQWEHVVASLGKVLEVPPHIGGYSALELRGKAHFLKPRGAGEIHLYSAAPLPRWVHRLSLGERLVEHRLSLFDFAPGVPVGETLTAEPWGPWGWALSYATPERAMLEWLDEVPQAASLEHAMEVFGLLPDLNSRRVLLLLKACRSVKVKRLFLALTARHASFHWAAPVLAAAERGEIALGSGKRSLVAGGRLDPKYLITLPEDRLV